MNTIADIHEKWMRAALSEARRAFDLGEIPVGAVVVRDGAIISSGHNTRETSGDPTGHAEIIALRQAAQTLGDWRLSGCVLYVTLEPCPMCAGAVLAARIERVIYGARDERQGCCGSLYRLTEDPAFDHFARASGGVMEAECASLLRQFMALSRQ